MSKSSQTTPKKSRDYDGRVFIFTTKKHWRDQCVLAKTIISDEDMDFSEIKIDDKPYLYELMTKLSYGRSELPQIFFNDKYIGGLQELEKLRDEGSLKPLLEEVKRASDPGPLYKVYRNQNEIFTISPSEVYFPPPLNRQITCVIRLTNRTNKYTVYKLKTTNPRKFSVTPKQGFLPPNQSERLTVTMNDVDTGAPKADKLRVEGLTLNYGNDELKNMVDDVFRSADAKTVVKQTINCLFETPPDNMKITQYNDGTIMVEELNMPSTSINDELIPSLIREEARKEDIYPKVTDSDLNKSPRVEKQPVEEQPPVEKPVEQQEQQQPPQQQQPVESTTDQQLLLEQEQQRQEKESVLEQERLEKERLEKERQEQERLEKERQDLETKRQEQEREELDRQEKERVRKEREENEAKERLLIKQKQEQEQQKLQEQQRVLKLQQEKLQREEEERLENERLEEERLEREEEERRRREEEEAEEEQRRIERERKEAEELKQLAAIAEEAENAMEKRVSNKEANDLIQSIDSVEYEKLRSEYKIIADKLKSVAENQAVKEEHHKQELQKLRDRIKETEEQLNAERALRKRNATAVASEDKQSGVTSASSKASPESKRGTPQEQQFDLIFVIIIALVAFVFGWLM